jgi:hypothetical protein
LFDCGWNKLAHHRIISHKLIKYVVMHHLI